MNKWTRPFEWTRESAQPAGGRSAPKAPDHLYFAFFSYSHKDSSLANWLHGELERFKVPSSLAGRLTGNGVIPPRLSPIFRDRHELAAADDLGEEINEALAGSRCLIVLCSPAAAKSKWTNAEVAEFKRLHPDGCVIAAIAAGEPFASDIEGREDEECLPPALRVKYDRRGKPTAKRAEPLAADLRDSGEGRRLGFLKIVAGILGVGLDDLVQREHLRRQRRLAAITAGSLGGMVIAGALAVTAIEARDEARDQRRAAESLVGFMLGDLKDKLEPLGRLDVLDSVGAKALAYYNQQDTSDLSDEALAQRSRALTLLGQVASDRGDLQAAGGFYQAAFEGTEEALKRAPDDAQRLFDHAQNVFYLGELARQRGDLPRAEAAMREYKRLALRMIANDPSDARWQMEGIYADTNLGVMLNDEGRFGDAAAVFENALVQRERLAADDPSNPQFKKALIEGIGWLMTARERQGRLDAAMAAGERQVQLLQPLIARTAADAEYKQIAAVAYRDLGRISAERGDLAGGIVHGTASLRLANQLIAGDPSNTFWLARGAWARFELARMLLPAGKTAEATALVGDGCDIADRLRAKDNSVLEWRLGLRSECLELQARLATSTGAFLDARDSAARLVEAARAEARPNSIQSHLALANAYLVQGLVTRSAGDKEAASAAFASGAAAWPDTAPKPPIQLARHLLVLRGAGRTAEANAIAAKLDSIGYREPLYLRDRATVG